MTKGKKRMREKNENSCLPPPQKKTKFVSKCSKHKKKLLHYIQLAENLLKLSAKNLLFSHSHVNQPKNCSKNEDLVKNAVFLLPKWSY